MSAAMAPGWGRHRARIDGELAPVRDWLVAAVAPRPGRRVLELGAASGDTGLAVAAAVGDGGRLISTDLTPEMVELGRRRAEEVGAGNVEHRVMDGQRIDLPDDSVDAVVARFVVMLMEEPDAALEGARRVLRPGGIIALSVWGPPERNPWLAVGGAVLRERGHLPPVQPGEPSPFALADSERLAGMLDAAGLVMPRVEEIAVTMSYRDAADYLVVSGELSPFGAVLRALPAGEIEELRRRVDAALAPFRTEEGFAVPGVALGAVATAP
jgi:ubiquinone/menaquinone biosynthesis C-methylase UbiE